MKRISTWIVTPDGLAVAIAALALSGTITSVSYFWWQGKQDPNPVIMAAGAVALAGATALLVGLRRAGPRWWPLIVPAYVMGLLLGLIVAPFAALDVEAGVFMALLAGPVLLVVLAWIAVWGAVLVFRATRHRRHRPAGRDDHSIVVTAS